MAGGTTQEIIEKAVSTVQEFFLHHMDDSLGTFPETLRSTGVWMGICAYGALGIFFLNEAEQRRVNDCRAKGIHPFPGFMIGERERPSEQRAAFSVNTSFRFFEGKSSAVPFAFSLGSDGSCVVIDHRHEVSDVEGNKAEYMVGLAFLLGCSETDVASDIHARLSELLDYCLDTWQSNRS